MAISLKVRRLGLAAMRALAHRTADPPSKRNVPPFQGGTLEHSMPEAVGVNAPQEGFLRLCRARAIPVKWKTPAKQGLRNMWTVGADSCAGVTPYCSVLLVG